MGLFDRFKPKVAVSSAEDLRKIVKICVRCGDACSPKFTTCPSCGARLPEVNAPKSVNCAKCGRMNEPDARFCSGCGEKLV